MPVQSEVRHHPSLLDPVASMPLRSVRLSVTCLDQLLVTEQIAAIDKAVSRHNVVAYDTCPHK